MLISILPFAAFGDINTYSSVVKAPESAVEAQVIDATHTVEDADGAEFAVVVNNPSSPYLASGDKLYVGTSRPSVDTILVKYPAVPYASGGTSASVTTPGTSGYPGGWEALTALTIPVAGVGYVNLANFVPLGLYSQSIDLKVVSIAPGTSNIVFGSDTYTGSTSNNDGAPAVTTYVQGKDFAASGGGSIANIIQQRRFAVQFTAAQADGLEISVSDSGTGKPANGVDTYTITASVTANRIPVSGKEVTFSITKGSGATLTASRATTDITGKATVKIYATKAGTYTVQARTTISPNPSAWPTKDVKFGTPGVVSIKAESGDNAKVSRTGGTTWSRKFSAYDASGTRVKIDATDLANMSLTKVVVTKPSGAALTDSNGFALSVDDGYGFIDITRSALTRDGDYEVKIYLPNGSAVSYKFNAKEQGEIVRMALDYGADSYAAGSFVPKPSITYYDAEGYTSSGSYTGSGDINLGISDASFLTAAGIGSNGSFTLKDKSGVITMTAVDTAKNLVATHVITVEKAASYLKLTPQTVGAVGGEVTVDIELVDVDGKKVAIGIEADAPKSSATIIAKPEGAIASTDSLDVDDFNNGEASVKVSSSVEGDVTLQVIIVDTSSTATSTGRAYTGACTVSFGRISAGGGQVIFIVGAPSYVAGNQVFAAESPAYIENGRTFLGVRDMGTAIGATIEWDQASETATLSKDGIVVKVTVGASRITLTKSGATSEIEIDAPARNNAGRVYLPFRAVMEAFNYTVAYDQATNSIVCTL
jgi:hypothetical protein